MEEGVCFDGIWRKHAADRGAQLQRHALWLRENKTRADAQRSYKELDAQVQALIPKGMCASVYTQWTDVEDEVNGIYTYDRKVRKIEG